MDARDEVSPERLAYAASRPLNSGRAALRPPLELVSVIDWLPLAALIAEPTGRVSAVNRCWCELTGRSAELSTGRRWLAVLDRADGLRFSNLLSDLASNGGTLSCDFQLRLPGGPCWTRWSARRTGHEDAPLVISVSDIDEDRVRYDRLLDQVNRDSLTGLFNRGHFVELTAQALRRDHLGRTAVVYVDLDGFKQVNDRHGHVVGDRVLTSAAERLQSAMRPGDLLARVGGDEFAVLFGDHPQAFDPDALAARIRTAFEAPLSIDGVDWRIGATVGVAVGSRTERNPEKLLASADRAMYAAKAAPRRAVDGNTFEEMYGRRQHPAVHPDPTEPQDLSGRLGNALNHLEKSLAQFVHDATPGAVVERAVITHLLDTAQSIGRAVTILAAHPNA